MKKIITAGIAALALTLTACGDTSTSESSVEETTTQETAEQTSTATEESEVTDSQAESWVRSQYGLGANESWMNAGGNASSITGVHMDGSNMYVTMQIDRNTEEDKADSVVSLLSNAFEMSPPEFADGVSWSSGEDGAGTVVKQKSV